MNDLLKSDTMLAIAITIVGLVSATEVFWQKIVLIVLAVVVVALRTYLKSLETWRK